MSSVKTTPPDGWAENFSYDYYRKLLRTLWTNYEVCTLSEYPDCRSNGKRVAVMRHDIDVCIERAVEMARFEHELGIQSTYMVIPDTPLYDIDDARDQLCEIADLGHEIGLHCDLDWETTDDREAEANIDSSLSLAEKKQIEDARRQLESIGIGPVTSLSFHQPVDRVLEGPSTIVGMVNAYSWDLMSAYISDSAGRWREGAPIERITRSGMADVLQVLTHPVWWAAEHDPPIERFLTVIDEEFAMVNEQMYNELVSIGPKYGDWTDQMLSRTPGTSG